MTRHVHPGADGKPSIGETLRSTGSPTGRIRSSRQCSSRRRPASCRRRTTPLGTMSSRCSCLPTAPTASPSAFTTASGTRSRQRGSVAQSGPLVPADTEFSLATAATTGWIAWSQLQRTRTTTSSISGSTGRSSSGLASFAPDHVRPRHRRNRVAVELRIGVDEARQASYGSSTTPADCASRCSRMTSASWSVSSRSPRAW